MTLACRRWLPDSAILGEQTLALAADCLAQWSRRWLAADALVLVGGWETCLVFAGEGDHHCPGGITIACRDDERLALASLLLGKEVRARSLRTRHDSAVIDSLLSDALDDLGKLLTVKFATGAQAGLSGDGRLVRLLCGAKTGGEALLAITMPVELLVAAVLDAAPRARIAPGVRSPSEAWAGQGIAVGALLGSCNVPLAEIERLQVGDVLVLDRSLGTPLDLTINDIAVAPAAVLVTPGNDNQTLVIERPAEQW